MFALIYIIFMMVAGEGYIMGLGDADFGDYVMDGTMTAERRIWSSFVCHHGSGHHKVFLLCENFTCISQLGNSVTASQGPEMSAALHGEQQGRACQPDLSPRSGAGQPRAPGQLQPQASGTSLAGRGQAGPSAHCVPGSAGPWQGWEGLWGAVPSSAGPWQGQEGLWGAVPGSAGPRQGRAGLWGAGDRLCCGTAGLGLMGGPGPRVSQDW